MEDIIEEKQETPTVGSPEEKAAVGKDAEPQPSIEELKQENKELKQETDRKEAVIKQLKTRRGVPIEEIDAFNKRLDGVEESQADLKDILNKHYGEDEESTSARKTERQKLDERRKETKVTPPVGADVQKFITYIDSQGLAHDDPLIEEATADERTPQDALKYLRGKMDEKSQGMIDKRAAEIAKNLVEQKLKDMGLTTTGVESPSAPLKDVSSMTPDEKLAEGFKQIKKK